MTQAIQFDLNHRFCFIMEIGDTGLETMVVDEWKALANNIVSALPIV